MDANDQPINPTGTEDLIPREAETEIPAGPATAEFVSQEDQEIADLKATMESETATPDEKEQARRGFQDRMERKELRKQTEEAKIEAAEERGRRKALETFQPVTGTPPTAPPQYQAPAFPEPEPKLDDFVKEDEDGFKVPDTERFVKAHTGWGVRKYAWDTNQAEESRRGQEWGQKGEAKTPGFLKKAKVVAERLVGPQGNAIGQAITTSDVSHELVLYLADNPSEVSRLMSSPRAQVEIGKIEARIATVKSGNARRTDAPNPGEPLKPTTSVETFDPLKVDAHTYAVKFHPATPEWYKNKA